MKVSPLYIGLFFVLAVILAGHFEHTGKKTETESGKNVHPILNSNPSFPLKSDATLKAADNYIKINYGSQGLFTQALMNYAQASEKFMSAQTPDEAYKENVAEGRAVDCVFYIARTIMHADTNLPLNAVDRVHALLTDTDDSAQSWTNAMQLVGTNFYPGVPVNQEASTCSSNISLPTPGIVTAQESN
ncbi:MAG: hypothetical protein KGQ58_04225 [Proteobacteria bacterium]|nr:hypothetical protein [Pseudomonadota bacterium]MDE3209019.1 hypothetical protein [Pseudomonadota bacterium]